MLELDELFGKFLDSGYERLSESEQDIFERLLETKDQELLDWLLLQAEPKDGDFKRVIAKIRQASLP